MPILEIRLLGSPTVTWNGAPQSILRRQTRILLYRLAVPGPPLSRDHLCFLFWSDIPESIAGRNLSHLLTHLRHALPTSDFLIATEDQVYLDPEFTWSDVKEFMQLRDIRNGRCGTDRLIRAVQLYQGPFLDGVSAQHHPDYESWMMLERRTLERRYRETLVALVDEFSRAGNYDQAIHYANRYLATDRLDESVHQRLISLYAARGDRAAALQQYRQCEIQLERELGVRPLPETVALYESVLRRNMSSPAKQSGSSAWTTLPGPRVPLVGREQAWEQMSRLYARALSGQGGMLLFTGEAGIGKSRLLEEFVTQAPARTLAAAGQPGTEALPYYMLIQAIRPQLRIDERSGYVENARLQGFSPVWLAEASRLLPELGGDKRIATLPMMGNINERITRPQLYECLCRFVQALTSDVQQAILCLDNLHWADDETLEWLAYFAPQLRHMPILVLAACRYEQCTRLDKLRQSLSHLGLLTELDLGGLAVQEIRQLLHYLLDNESQDDQLAQRLHKVTGGNPFFVIQTVTALMESGLLPEQWADIADLPMPVPLCAAVGERLDSLDPVTLQVIEACTILAPVFGFDLVRLTSGRRELETLDSLEKLVTQRLLDNHGAEYCFHQDLIRRILEDRMSPMRRQLLHRRAGRALEQLNRHALDDLARHYAAGDEPVKAAHFHELAVQHAEALFARKEAEAHRTKKDRLQPQ